MKYVRDSIKNSFIEDVHQNQEMSPAKQNEEAQVKCLTMVGRKKKSNPFLK